MRTIVVGVSRAMISERDLSQTLDVSAVDLPATHGQGPVRLLKAGKITASIYACLPVG